MARRLLTAANSVNHLYPVAIAEAEGGVLAAGNNIFVDFHSESLANQCHPLYQYRDSDFFGKLHGVTVDLYLHNVTCLKHLSLTPESRHQVAKTL